MIIPFNRKLLPYAVLSVTLTVETSTALANTQGANFLEEVVVTARKKVESLQDTPVVVNVVSEKTLKSYAVDSVDDISRLVPGLTVNAEGGSGSTPQLNLRGITTGSINIANDQAISLNIDGVQYSNSAILRAGSFDLAGVEVLKGPQALFFGKNSPGGIIVLRTADPTEELFTEFSAGYEMEADAQNYTAIVSGPMTENLLGRLAAQYTTTDGHFENQHPNPDHKKALFYDEYILRGTLLADFDTTSIKTKLTYADRDGGPNQYGQRFVCADPNGGAEAGDGSFVTDCKLNNTYSVEAPATAVFSPAGRTLYIGNEDRYKQADPFAESQILATSIEVESELNNNWTSNFVTGYNKINTHDFTTLIPAADGIFILERDAELETFSQEFRFSGDFDSYRLMFGAFFDDRSVELRQLINIVGFQYPTALQTQDSNAYSFFGQVEYDFTEQLSLSVGARYINETKSIKGENLEGGAVLGAIGPLGAGLAFATPVGPYTYATTEFSDDDVSPEITLSYKPTDDTMFYASYKEGFKSGGFDFGSTSNPMFSHPRQALIDGNAPIERAFAPESVDGFELGMKSEFADNTLRMNAALFSYKYEDLQVAVFDPELVTQRTLNAAAATVEGAEVDLTYATPVDGLTLFGSVAYVKAEYDNFIGPCNSVQQGGGQAGCNVDVSAAQDGSALAQNRSGQPLVRAPEWVFDLGANYETNISDDLLFRSDLRATWTDEYQTETLNDPRAIQGSHVNVNLSLGIEASDESWALDLIGTNLTDEAVLIGSAPRDGANADLYGSRNMPRELTLRITARPHLLF